MSELVNDRLVQDARVALRALRRNPTFTVSAVVILGLAIGMAAAMWTVFNAVVLRTLPVRDQNEIITLHAFDQSGTDIPLSRSDFDRLRDESRTMHDVAGFAHWGAFTSPLVGRGGQSVVLASAQVTGNFFGVLGARPALGRLLQPSDDVPGAAPVMVMSFSTWQRQFGGDPAVIGHVLTDPGGQINYSIVGVAPPGLDYPLGVECWTATALWGRPYVSVFARLAPGSSIAAARSEFIAFVQQMDRGELIFHPVRFEATTLATAVVGNVKPVLVALTGAVGLLLLIACVNVGTLLLMRAAMRSRELAVRGALGATYTAIVRLLLTESALLGIGGGLLGLACAEAVRRTLVALAPPQLPRTDVVLAAGLPVGVAAAVSILAVLLFGVAPAFVAVRRNPASPIRLDARGGNDSRQRRRLRHGLVAAQLALAVVMLAGAGLLARTLQRLEQLHLGYTPSHLSILQLSIPWTKYDSMPSILRLYDGIGPRLSAVPGVVAATPVLIPPFMGMSVWIGSWEAEGRTSESGPAPTAPFEVGDAQYFRTFGIPILRGRGFLDTDRENAPRVAVVSETMARQTWPGRDPIGQRLRAKNEDVWRTVVGVAGDIRIRSLRDASPTVFLPYHQFNWQGYIAIRTAGELAAVLPAIRRTLSEVDPSVGLWRARTMDQFLDAPLAQPRMSALLMSGFGLVALLLSAIGLYGVMASAVREQTRELGVRMALGASPKRLLGDVLRRAMGVSAAGAAVGLGAAVLVSRFARALLFEVGPNDPIALLGACTLLLVVALIAAYVPARLASRVDPARALQAD
jgi:putative ABC transport system permease protein